MDELRYTRNHYLWRRWRPFPSSPKWPRSRRRSRARIPHLRLRQRRRRPGSRLLCLLSTTAFLLSCFHEFSMRTTIMLSIQPGCCTAVKNLPLIFSTLVVIVIGLRVVLGFLPPGTCQALSVVSFVSDDCK